MELRELHKRASARIQDALNSVCKPSLREIGPVRTVKEGHVPRNAYLDRGKPLVSVTAAKDGVKAAVSRAVEALGGWSRALNTGDKILIKPNYNSPDAPPGSTDVEFLTGVVELLMEEGYGDIMVGDCSGLLWHPTTDVFEKTGVSGRMKALGVPLVSFDDGPWVDVPIEGRYLNKVTVPEAVLRCDKILYLPCMKTHRLARFTMSLKLGVGLLHPAMRPVTLHEENLEEKCSEINLAVRPDLIVMDGRVAFISGGPASGDRVCPDLVLASGDQVAIDVEGVKILQSYHGENLLDMKAAELPLISHAAEMGVGRASDREYKVVSV